ncbi:Phage head completion protein (GPL) [Vibrio coralliirubri]|uniref:head completion/stabilization protein n=1 Tax=Vibrio coralliirubri TaxID=1516159 RepID=UPI0006371DE9|nr:head completion/stabilization protein [Vibrio coralliirubri]CDT98588.1 Phage head completion protein (GPL) [Vibrio coralliirubri]
MFTGSPDTDYQDTEITNDDFWPDLNAGDFEKRRGIPAAQDPERITIALVNAMAEVNRSLDPLKAQYQEQGYTTAADVPVTPVVNGRNRVVIQYESAVNSRAKADLLPDIATVHTKDKGDHLADRAPDTRDELLAESQRIIRNMLGVSRSSMDLL